VFVANGDFELPEVTARLSGFNATVEPDVKRNSEFLMARRVVFDDGSEGYFVFNQGNEPLKETITLQSNKNLYEIDLFNGDEYSVPYTKEGDKILLPVSLLRGEGAFFHLTNQPLAVKIKPVWEKVYDFHDFKSRISRIYKLDYDKGVVNYYPETAWKDGLVEWDEGLSGEATYVSRIPSLQKGEYRLNLGRVRHYAKVYIDGKKIDESTLYPYTVKLPNLIGGEELKIIVANTPANECARSDYFGKHAPKDVGPYNENMVISEAKEGAGGLFGPITIEKRK